MHMSIFNVNIKRLVMLEERSGYDQCSLDLFSEAQENSCYNISVWDKKLVNQPADIELAWL